MFFKPFELRGHRQCPHKTPSNCNTSVIPMLLNKFCPRKPQKPVHTHTRPHTHTHTHTLQLLSTVQFNCLWLFLQYKWLQSSFRRTVHAVCRLWMEMEKKKIFDHTDESLCTQLRLRIISSDGKHSHWFHTGYIIQEYSFSIVFYRHISHACVLSIH